MLKNNNNKNNNNNNNNDNNNDNNNNNCFYQILGENLVVSTLDDKIRTAPVSADVIPYVPVHVHLPMSIIIP